MNKYGFHTSVIMLIARFKEHSEVFSDVTEVSLISTNIW